MELNSTEISILALLRAALMQQEPVLPQEVDWNAVYAEAELQAITPLLASKLPHSLAETEQARWERRAGQYIAFYYQLMEEQTRLVKVFQDAQIPIVILKGSAASVYYPEPVLRTMGEIDFIVPQERFNEAMELMKVSGYKSPGKEGAEPGKVRDVAFTRGGVSIELHNHFSNDVFDMEFYIRDGLARPVEGQLEDYVFPMLPTLNNGAMLLSHMCQHLRIKMGLRQVLDWMMFVNAVLDDAYWESTFKKVAEEFGMVNLAVTVTRMCQKYLGLSERITWCAGADERLCDELLQSLFASGNFARKLGREWDVEIALNAFRRLGLFRHLQQRGLANWEAAKHRPCLRPFAWLYQIFRYLGLTLRRGISADQLKEHADNSNRFSSMLHELGLE